MTIYESNLKALAKYYPDMDKDIEVARKNTIQELDVVEEISQDGESIFRIVKEKHGYYLAGKRSAKRPPHEWFLEQGELPDNFTFIFFGIGNIGYLRELIENVNARLNIIIYEPSIQIFLKSLEMYDLSEGLKKHMIVFWVDGIGQMTEDKFDGILRRVLNLENMSKIQLFILPNYDNIFPEQCNALIEQCNAIARIVKVSFNTKKAFAKVTGLNVLKNAKYLCKGYKTIQLVAAISKDIPGILVAAGPSLNKNIKELKKAKGKAFIIAVDTAIKPLLREGIIPDMYCIVDAEKPLHLVEVEESKNIPMVTTLNASPDVLDYHTGMKIFYDEGYAFAEEILLKDGLPWGDVSTGGSVATNIFSMLCRLGLETIILVGQDLALTGNKSHADGTFEEHMPDVDTTHAEWVEGNYEDKVPTRVDFQVFLSWYEDTIKIYKNHSKEFRVINATEGGAKIKGTEVMTLKEAIAQTCVKEVNIQECLEKLTPMLSEESQKWAEEYLRSIPTEFERLEKDAMRLRKLYKDLDRLCSGFKLDEAAYLKLMKKIKKQIKRVEKYKVYQLITLTIPAAAVILRQDEGEEMRELEEEGKEIARKGTLYTELVGEAAGLLGAEAKKIYGNWK